MSSGTGFWNFMAKRYARTPISDQASYERKLELTREYFTPDSEVLEFGCGTGSTALLHAPHVRQLLATDFSRAMIDIAEDKRRAEGADNVRFECLGIDALDPARQHYDVVLGLNVVHLLPNWESSLARVYQLLKPGGVFVSSTACIDDFMPAFKLVAVPAAWLGLLPKLAFFTQDQLTGALRDCGFEIEKRWHPAPKKAVFIVARKPGPA